MKRLTINFIVTTFLLMRNFRIIFVLALYSLLLSLNSVSQSNNIHITNLTQPDSRIEVSMHHNRTIGIGAQYVGVSIKNKTDHKLRVVLEFYVDLTCGEQLKQKIGFGNGIIIKPGMQTNPSGFMDTDNTSIDAGNRRSSECLKSVNKSIKLPDGGSTVVSSVGFNLIRIDDLDANVSVSNQTNDNSIANSNSTSNSTSYSSSNCPPQSLDMVNVPSDNCVQLRWINQSTINYNENSEELYISGNYPVDFILAYKRTEDINWKEINIQNYQFGYNLLGLEACTKYEVKLQRDCGSGERSIFSNTVTFSTACVSPKNITISNITSTSAKIGGTYKPAMNNCSLNSQKPSIIVEYKSSLDSDWQSVICIFGQGCQLNILLPNTTYKVRKRYKYLNERYSEYSSEKTFKTLP